VFPNKITVEYKAQDPQFHSFMMTDASGYNSFFHTLTFYEEINEAEVDRGNLDIDAIVKEVYEKKNRNKSKKRKSSQKDIHQTKEI
jgi:hypothetical protein